MTVTERVGACLVTFVAGKLELPLLAPVPARPVQVVPRPIDLSAPITAVLWRAEADRDELPDRIYVI